MATIPINLLIFILFLACVWLQSLEHYQSIFCFLDLYGYNRQTITNLYSVYMM
jgi:hypothetical protein